MKNSCRYAVLSALVFLGRGGIFPASAQTLPLDPKASCTVSAETFASWFESGTPAVNGVVNPANSVKFSHANNCAFYQWSAQMFLWLTSPVPASYGGTGGRIFDSPVFFDVSPLVGNNPQVLIPHTPGKIRIPPLRAAKAGPNKLPVIMDKRGQLFEILKPAGKQPEIAKLSVEKGLAVFHDKAGKKIARPKVIVPPQLKNARVVQKLIIDGKPIFVDPVGGGVIETEEGQADFSVLIAQNGSLVYYLTMVNDVYAYFLTATATGVIKPPPNQPLQFPTTQGDLDKITAFAATYGVKFPDPNALAIELKSAWVETKGLPNPDSYITMEATVPTYDTTDPMHWSENPNGQKPVRLALVGMHVVGSAAGHPEMIWSTFEHFGNAPNAAYQYLASDGITIKTVPQDGPGQWLFASPNLTGPFNVAHAQINAAFLPSPGCAPTTAPNDICVSNVAAITPSDTMRMAPFGAAPDVTPNAEDASPAASNAEIISLNNSVLGPLKSLGNDVRANYYMVGSTWTNGGVAPTGPFNSPSPTPSGSPTPTPIPGSGNEVGTSQLANTTMETYQQIQTPNPGWDPGVNCFACHAPKTSSPIAATDLSHIFGNLKPLPPPPGKSKAAPKKP